MNDNKTKLALPGGTASEVLRSTWSASGRLATAAACALLVAFSAPAGAQEADAPPLIEGTVLFELQNDYAFDSDDPAAEINDLFTTIEAALALNINEFISIQSLFVVEPVLDPAPFDDRFFEDHGGYFEELYLQFAFGNFRIFGGKFDASFGTAWDKAPGIYGVDFAEDYELVERVGGGIAVSGQHMTFGDVTVTANVFFADTSVLSESIFTNRGRVRVTDGGASNTESLESVSLTLDGENVASIPDFTYHLGYRHQAAGAGDAGDEDGFVAGFTKGFMMADGNKLETIVEGVYLDQADGGPDDLYYLTAGAAYLFGPWNVSGSYTLRETDVVGGPDVTDHLAQLTAGYEFQSGVTLDAGYRYAREDDVETHIIGVLLTYEYDVAKGFKQLSGLGAY